MKLCFFNRSYWPDFGATGQLLTELAEDLVHHHGCEVSVVAGLPLNRERAAGGRGWPVRREWRRGVEIVRCAGTTRATRHFPARALNYGTYFASACLSGLVVRRPDVVVTLTDPPIIGLAALLAARRAGARFVFLCQDIFPEVARVLEDFESKTVNRALDRINKFLVARADRIIALGETMRERLIVGKHAHPDRVSVIHNWADCAAMAPGPKVNAFSTAHDLARKFVVMHAGNLGQSQNLDVLVDAAAMLRHIDDVVFVFVGDGSRREALERRARDASTARRLCRHVHRDPARERPARESGRQHRPGNGEAFQQEAAPGYRLRPR